MAECFLNKWDFTESVRMYLSLSEGTRCSATEIVHHLLIEPSSIPRSKREEASNTSHQIARALFCPMCVSHYYYLTLHVNLVTAVSWHLGSIAILSCCLST